MKLLSSSLLILLLCSMYSPSDSTKVYFVIKNTRYDTVKLKQMAVYHEENKVHEFDLIKTITPGKTKEFIVFKKDFEEYYKSNSKAHSKVIYEYENKLDTFDIKGDLSKAIEFKHKIR